MNNEAKNNENSGRKWITRVIIGGVLVYVGYRAYKLFGSDSEEHENSVDENEIKKNAEEKKAKVEELKASIPKKSKSLIDRIHDGLLDDPMYSSDDIEVVELSDLDGEPRMDIDEERFDSYTMVSYIENDKKLDNYIRIVIKFPDELKSELREKADKDPSYTNIIDRVEELLNSKYEYERFGFSHKTRGFYRSVDCEDGKIKYKDLRSLEALIGVRSVELRFFKLEQDKDSGAEFILELLKIFHPDGGEEDDYFGYMPIIIDKTGNRINLPQPNNNVDRYLKNE